MTVAMKLTDRQQEVLEFILNFKEHNDYCPTTLEIAQALFIGKSTAYRYLLTLQDKGYIKLSYKKIRAIRILKES